MNPIRTRKNPLVTGVAIWAALIAINAYAEECNQHFASDKTPALINTKLGVRTHQICYENFSVLTSGITKTAIWSAEHLTRDNIMLAERLKRENPFHIESSISNEDRAELSDYARSGFDRGHMAPNGDMPTKEAQFESFTLANMIPQNGENNRGPWADVESDVRKLAKRSGEVYVVTGPAFIADSRGQLDSLKGRVLVPTHVWKAVYDPQSRQSMAYWVANSAEGQVEQISVNELKNRSGIDPFPALPENIKQSAMTMESTHRRAQQNSTSNSEQNSNVTAEVITKAAGKAVLKHLLRF